MNKFTLPRLLTRLLLLCTTAFAGDYSTWAKYRNVTVNTAGINSTGVGKIPVLIRLNVTGQFDMFTQSEAVLPNGADIRITKADGTTDLPFEVDSWTSGTSGAGALWVLLDTLPPNTSYPLRIYWNKAGVTTASNGPAVFSAANGFLAAWHFSQEAGLPLLDATGNNTATPAGGAAAPTNNASSIIGFGKTFNGTSQFYQVGTDASALNLNSNTGPYTITAWANVDTCTTRVVVFSKYANSNSTAGGRQYALQTATTPTSWRITNAVPALSTNASNNEFAADDLSSCSNKTWTYLAASYETRGAAPVGDSIGASKLQLRVNSRPIVYGTLFSETGSSIGTASNTYIGKIASNDRYMKGSLDEITVSNVTRSADWLRVSYENQKAGSTTVSIDAQSTPPTTAVAGGLQAHRSAGKTRLVLSKNGVLLERHLGNGDTFLHTLDGKRFEADQP